jgi:hypothetical protein
MPFKFNALTGNFDIVNPSLENPLQFKGSIDSNDDFPTSAAVKTGWFYKITADVTDNDATKTNTGQSFVEGDEIAWNGDDWSILGNENLDLQGVTDNGNTTTNEIIHADESGNGFALTTVEAGDGRTYGLLKGTSTGGTNQLGFMSGGLYLYPNAGVSDPVLFWTNSDLSKNLFFGWKHNQANEELAISTSGTFSGTPHMSTDLDILMKGISGNYKKLQWAANYDNTFIKYGELRVDLGNNDFILESGGGFLPVDLKLLANDNVILNGTNGITLESDTVAEQDLQVDGILNVGQSTNTDATKNFYVRSPETTFGYDTDIWFENYLDPATFFSYPVINGNANFFGTPFGKAVGVLDTFYVHAVISDSCGLIFSKGFTQSYMGVDFSGSIPKYIIPALLEIQELSNLATFQLGGDTHIYKLQNDDTTGTFYIKQDDTAILSIDTDGNTSLTSDLTAETLTTDDGTGTGWVLDILTGTTYGDIPRIKAVKNGADYFGVIDNTLYIRQTSGVPSLFFAGSDLDPASSAYIGFDPSTDILTITNSGDNIELVSDDIFLSASSRIRALTASFDVQTFANPIINFQGGFGFSTEFASLSATSTGLDILVGEDSRITIDDTNKTRFTNQDGNYVDFTSFDGGGGIKIPYWIPQEQFSTYPMIFESGLFLAQELSASSRIWFGKGGELVTAGFVIEYNDITDYLAIYPNAITGGYTRVLSDLVVDDNLVVDTDLFFVDATEGNAAIGTDTPLDTTKFTVQSDGTRQYTLYVDGATNAWSESTPYTGILSTIVKDAYPLTDFVTQRVKGQSNELTLSFSPTFTGQILMQDENMGANNDINDFRTASGTIVAGLNWQNIGLNNSVSRSPATAITLISPSSIFSDSGLKNEAVNNASYAPTSAASYVENIVGASNSATASKTVGANATLTATLTGLSNTVTSTYSGAGSYNVQQYGIRNVMSGNADVAYACYNQASAATVSWALYNAAGDSYMAQDNAKTYWGSGSDISIYFNGTDMYIQSENVAADDELVIKDFSVVKTDGVGKQVNTTRVTTTYTILTTDDVVFANTDSVGYTVTLPAGVEGQTFKIINSGSSSNNLTVAPNGSEHLLGANSNFTLADGETLILTYNATDGWY